jgi:hypothetical protein
MKGPFNMFKCDNLCYDHYFPVVLLPGFQKGRDVKASQGKGQGAVLAKKGQFALYKEKQTEFHSFLGQ